MAKCHPFFFYPRGPAPFKTPEEQELLQKAEAIGDAAFAELLKVLCEMGHTDELTIGDGNFPGHTYGKRVIRMDGHGVPEILELDKKLEIPGK